ncbi:hypothetical protein BJ165DRAFT_1464381 [Panaeolus papilionaceus]|nr:hypothetical protein BJ165DRAFT_1464381 [Panaeolus papilionaceus]
MRISIVFIASLMAVYAQAYSVDDVFERRAYDLVEDHYTRSDMLSELTTRELVEELEARLERRGGSKLGGLVSAGRKFLKSKLPGSSGSGHHKSPPSPQVEENIPSDDSPTLN